MTSRWQGAALKIMNGAQNHEGGITPALKDTHAQLKVGRSKAAIVGSFWSSLNTFIPAILGLIVFYACSTILGPKEFGLVAFGTGIISIGSALAPVGFQDAIVRESVVEKRHLNTVFTLLFGFAVIVYTAVCFWSVFILDGGENPVLQEIIPVLGLTLIFQMITVVPNALLTRAMNFRAMAIRTSIASVIAALVSLSILYLGFGIWALVAAQLTSVAANMIGALVSVKWFPRLTMDISALKDFWRFGVFSSGSRIITVMRFEEILIGSLLGASMLGLYNFAKRIFTFLNNTVSGALNSVSFSLFSSLQHEKEKRDRVFLLTTFMSASLSFPVFLGLLAIAKPLIGTLFSEQWADAVPVLQSFCVFGVMSCIGIIQASFIKSAGFPERWFLYGLVKKFIIVSVIFFTFSFGLTVMAWAIAMVSVFTWPFAVRIALSLSEIDVKDYLSKFMGPGLASIGMVVGVLGIASLQLKMSPFINLGVQIFTGASIYIILLTCLCYKDFRPIIKIVSEALRK